MSVLAGLNTQRNNELSQEVGDWGDMHDPTIGDSLNPADMLGAVPRVMARSSINMMGIPSAMALSNIPAAIDKVAGTNTQDWWFKHTVDPMIEQSDRMLPDPSTTHVAMQTVDGLLGFAGEMAMSGGPINFGILSKITSEVKELHAGKDLQTARNISDLTGLTNMVFAGAPLSIASKASKINPRVQGAISGAVGMDVIGSVSEEAHKQALEAGGYHDEAQQHDWNTWQGHAFNLAFGGITGAIHPHVLPSHKDALLTVNEAHAIQNPDGLSATHPAANNALVDNMNSAVHALANDKPVTSALNITDGFIQDPAKGELEQQIAQHIANQHIENNQQAINEFSASYPDVVKSIVDKQYKEQITAISDQAGWSQRGGEVIRNTDQEVVGRTNWLPRQEWFGRFVAEDMGNQASLQKAVNKFISGEKLGPKQSKIIDWLKDEVDGKNQDGDPESFTVTTAHGDLNNRILEHIESIQEQRRQEHSDKTGQFIHDDIVKQLEDAGHYDAEKNSAFARLQQIVFVNQAKEAGMSPRAYYEKYGNTQVVKGGDESLSDAFGQVFPNALPDGMELGDANKLSAMYRKEDKTKAVLLGQADSRLIADGLKENAHLVTFSHSADQSALNHIRKNHTDETDEANRGQLPVTDADIAKITDIIKDYDGIRFDLLSSYGKPVIAYVKKFKDGIFLYTEEVHNKRHDLAALSMRKYPATADASSILKNVGPNVRNDGEHGFSIGKPPKASKPFDGKEEAKTPLKEGATHIDVDGVQRHALNSNGKPIHPTEEGVRNFWRWYGDSKVVDDQGRPLVVYHGTDKDFTEFDTSLSVQDHGIYLTTDVEYASGYANSFMDSTFPGANVMPLFARITSPEFFLVKPYVFDEKAVDELSKKGTDGAIVGMTDYEVEIGVRSISKAEEIVAFNPTQIKSAIGNNGNFDNADPNILHQSTKGAYHPDTNVISLFKSADASTFLHESGHQFLELYNNMRLNGDASALVKADMDHLLNWFGIKDFDAWSKMSLEQQRPYHEQFAKGFETYLAEGKAPTPELQGVFKNFAQWLKEVYSDIQGKLGANLTDDVRGVMDRIIHHGESEPHKSDTPEITAARESIPDIPADKLFEIEHDDGSTDTGSAAELMARADQEAAFAEQSDAATSSAITCFLKFGDL